MAKKSKIPDECVEIVKHPIISLEENRMKMIFNNKNRKAVSKIKVDGCAVKDGIRCDWLVKNDKDYEHFVELKGTDVIHACKQLAESIAALSDNPAKNAKHSFIISSRRVPFIQTNVQNWIRKFKDRFNCTLVIKNNQHEFEL